MFLVCVALCRRSVITRAMSEKIEIDITSDTVCPWCYIGKRRLEKAIKQLQATLFISVLPVFLYVLVLT